MMSSPTRCFLTVLTIIVMRPGQALAQSSETDLTTAIRDWQSRQEIARSVKYEANGTCTFPAGRFGESPKEDFTCELRDAWLLHFANNWARKEQNRQEFFPERNVFAPTYRKQVYDGENYVTYAPRERNTSTSYTPSAKQPDVMQLQASQLNLFLSDQDLPVFFAHGVIPTRQATIRANHLVLPLQSSQFSAHGRGEHDGVVCVILRSGPDPYGGLYEYWVDQNQRSAIRSYTHSIEGKSRTHFDVRYKKTEWGWLPDSWIFTWYDLDGKINEVDRLTVTSISINPEVVKGDFQIPLTPGRVVAKSGEGPTNYYRVSSDGVLIDFVEADSQSGTSLMRWVLGSVVALAMIVLALTIVIVRRTIRKQASNNARSPSATKSIPET